jgi:hypothetical protein
VPFGIATTLWPWYKFCKSDILVLFFQKIRREVNNRRKLQVETGQESQKVRRKDGETGITYKYWE